MQLDDVHIGVDVDGVLADHLPAICRELRDWKDVDFYPEDVQGWNSPIPGLDMHLGEAMHHLTENPAILADMDPVAGAIDGMHALQATGATVTIVTHRKWENHDVTKQWLAAHDIPYDSFADNIGPNVCKSTAETDILIDDYVQNLVAVSDAGNHGVMMLHQGNFDNIPPRDTIHIAGTAQYTTETLAQNRALQWEALPSVIEQLAIEGAFSE